MCHISWNFFGLPHGWVVPSDVVHVLSMLFACEETCLVLLGYILEWIIQKLLVVVPLGGYSTTALAFPFS